MDTLLKTMSGLLVILNEDRQVVTVNQGLLDELGIKDVESILGLRIGEVLSCINSDKQPFGCGTTSLCSTCGAAIATMAAINNDKTSEQICVLTKKEGNESSNISLLIRAQPVIIDRHRWILFFAQDITQQQLWINLERVFFHDISNSLTTLLGNSELLAMDIPDNGRIQQNKKKIEKLCQEVSLQMGLSHQKDAKYLLRKSEISIEEIKEDLSLFINGHKSSKNKEIHETWPENSIKFHSDILLITKVLGNMTINALEATPKDGKIKLTVAAENNILIFKVWNNTHIPSDIQKRIFQQFFSTKAKVGRGIGTYSMKLYGEKYLKGKLDFVSNVENGTIFTFKLPI